MLSVDSLVVNHGKNKLIGPVSFEVLAAEPLVIMGETGAGKSLVAQSVMGALPDTLTATGEIYLDKKRIDQLPGKEREQLWGRSLSMLPQEPWRALDPLMRSFKQVHESHHLVAGLSSREARQKTKTDFQQLSLEGAERKRPGKLSGGMGQRVAFAAALAGGAPVLLADEPTKGLDADRVKTVNKALTDFAAKGGVLVVITHDVTVAEAIGGQLLVLKDGNVVESGATQEIIAAPNHDYTKALIQADPQHWENLTPAASGDTLLETKHLIAGRQGIAMTPTINLQLTQGQRVAITGPSGVGKSTLLDTLASLIQPIKGTFTTSPAMGPTDIQKLYQDPPASFAPGIALKKSLMDVAKLHRVPWNVIEELLDKLGIDTEMLKRGPNEVSGGELQRIAIARALSIQPKLLLADEPTSRLDPITQKETMKLLADVTSKSNTAVLLVTHDKVMAEKWAGDTIAL